MNKFLIACIAVFSVLMFAGCSADKETATPATETERAASAVPAPQPQAPTPAPMSDQAKLAVAQDMLDAWNKLDWERVYALFGSEGVLANMMTEPTVGEAAIRERLKPFETGLTRMDFEVLRLGAINGEVVVERLDSFDYNGHTGIVPVVGVMHIEDGHVKEWREYYDRNWLLGQMGVIEAEPPHPLAPSEPAVGDEMSDEQRIAVARAMLDAYEALDWEKAISLIADDGVIHYVEKEPMQGPAAMRAHVERVGPKLTRVEFRIRNIGVIDGVVMIERVDDFDYDGHHVSVPVYGTMEVSGGKISVWREYYDHEQMLRGMGLAE